MPYGFFKTPLIEPYLWLIRASGVLVPHRWRADWRQEREAEFQWREQQLAQWNLRGALVVARVTISIVVLIGAGLFLRSLGQVVKTDPGFKTENLVTLMINPRLLAYEVESSRRFFCELQQRLEAQPGVRAAALVNEVPLMTQQLSRGPVMKEGELDPPPNRGVSADYNLVTPKYFDTLQTPLVLGRNFTDRDTAEAPPVVIVNQEFARRFYGSEQSALEKRFRLAPDAHWLEIIGIAKVGDMLRLIITQGMRMVWVGLALGLAGALALTRALTNLLLGVGTTDPLLS